MITDRYTRLEMLINNIKNYTEDIDLSLDEIIDEADHIHNMIMQLNSIMKEIKELM